MKGPRGGEPTLTKAQLARALKLSHRQIDNLVADEKISRVRKGRRYEYPLEAIRQYVTWLRDQQQKPSSPIDELKYRQALVQAELAELELAKKRGEMLTRDVHEAALASALDRVRAAWLTFPAGTAPRLVGSRGVGEMELKLEEAVHQKMRELVEMAAEMGLDIKLNGDDDTARGKKKRPKNRRKRGRGA